MSCVLTRLPPPLLSWTPPPRLFIVPAAHSIGSYLTLSSATETGPTAEAGEGDPRASAAAVAAANARRVNAWWTCSCFRCPVCSREAAAPARTSTARREGMSRTLRGASEPTRGVGSIAVEVGRTDVMRTSGAGLPPTVPTLSAMGVSEI